MITLTPKEAGERLALFADEGRLIAGEWHAEYEGRQLACALGAMHPEIESSADCPGDVMPSWLAGVVVGLFDGQGDEERVKWATRFAEQLQHARWSSVDWGNVRVEWLISITTSALESARKVAGKEGYWQQVESAHRQVVAALRGDGDLSAARAAAWAAERAAAWAAESAAARAAESAAARAAAWAAESAAARAAASAAAWAAASAAASAAAWAAAWAAESAAWAAQAATLCDLIDGQLEGAGA